MKVLELVKDLDRKQKEIILVVAFIYLSAIAVTYLEMNGVL